MDLGIVCSEYSIVTEKVSAVALQQECSGFETGQPEPFCAEFACSPCAYGFSA